MNKYQLIIALGALGAMSIVILLSAECATALVDALCSRLFNH